MTDPQEIEAELNLVFQQLQSLETNVRVVARQEGIDPMLMREATGHLAMQDIVTAKAQVLSALAPFVQRRFDMEINAELFKREAESWRRIDRAVGDPGVPPERCSVCHDTINQPGAGTLWVHSNGFARSLTPHVHSATPE